MKLRYALIFLTMLASPVLAGEPKEVVAAFSAALQAGDRERALSLMDPNVVIYEGGFVERSRGEYASHHLAGDIAFSRVVKSKTLKESQHIDGNTAVVWEETETTGNYKGKEVHSFGTGTVLLVRKGENWLITHVHWSSRKAK